MKILFSIFHPGFVRHFTPALRMLCGEGWSVHLAFHNEKMSAEEWTRDLREGNPNVTYNVKSPRRSDAWAKPAHRLRQMRNYAMYFDPRYAKAHRLRDFAAQEIVPKDRAIVERVAAEPDARREFDRRLEMAERSIPTDPQIDAFIAEHAPDVFLVTPLVTFTSPQVDYVKSARAMGIPSALCVASWDNLTNKGMIREIPDRVIVWNEAQAEEAVTLHGASRDELIVTGAQSFDHWFEARPSRDKETFMRERGLDPASALISYFCSSTSISPNEIEFIRQWHGAVRNARDPRVAGAAILARPHPMNDQPWEDLDALGLANFDVWPRNSPGPFTAEGRRDYFDAIHHSAAVVGLNTSAQVEAGLIGKPVLTILSEDIPLTLYGTTDTVHFHHLVGVNGGLLHVAASFEEHVRQLARAIDGDPEMAARSRRFTHSFIRPHGLERPAAPMLADAIRCVASLKPRQRPLESAAPSPMLGRLLGNEFSFEDLKPKRKEKPAQADKASSTGVG